MTGGESGMTDTDGGRERVSKIYGRVTLLIRGCNTVSV